MCISSIIFKCREHFLRVSVWLQQHWQMCQVLCYWFSGLEATLHHRTSPATTIRFLRSLGILLTAENYSLACIVHKTHTIFSHLHLSLQVYIKTSGMKKREQEIETCTEGFLSHSALAPAPAQCRGLAQAVTQKGTGCSLSCHSSFVFS